MNNKNIINNFRNVSIRGRVAFSIHCLEKALMKLNAVVYEWELLLNQLWEYTEIKYLDEWHETTVEFLPEIILSNSYNANDFDRISENHFNILSNLYEYSNEINEIINLIFEIGTIELYGKLVGDGELTLKELDNLINIMIFNGIPIPDILVYKQFSFKEENGWGVPFNKKIFDVRVNGH